MRRGKIADDLEVSTKASRAATASFLVSAIQISCSARLALVCRRFGSLFRMLAVLCTLCRRRHKVHYAELRIMPTSAAKPAWEAVIAVKEAA